jgi:hypothetical protein
VFNYIVFPANDNVKQLSKKKDEAARLVSDIEPLIEDFEDKKAERTNAEEKYEIIKSEEAYKTATSEEFLVFLGNSAEKNGVKVTGFSDLGNKYENGLYKSYYDVELSGMPLAVNRAINELNTMGIKYSVGSFSFRQDKEYDYLKRFFDTMTGLSWYKEPEEEKEEPPVNETEKENEPQEDEVPLEKPLDEKPIQEKPKEENNVVQKNEPVQGIVIEPGKNQGTVLPEDKNIEDRLNELLKTGMFNPTYRVMPLTNTIAETDILSSEMRLSFTVCLIMFNEPSEETSFINITETEDADGVF